jgi:hypothetical protein
MIVSTRRPCTACQGRDINDFAFPAHRLQYRVIDVSRAEYDPSRKLLPNRLELGVELAIDCIPRGPEMDDDYRMRGN